MVYRGALPHGSNFIQHTTHIGNAVLWAVEAAVVLMTFSCTVFFQEDT